MATNYYYIATPFGDLEQPCWRLVEAEVGGADAIVFSLRLRGMAAQAGRGGLISLHDGTPMQIDQICSVLGYTPQRVHRSLEILHRHRLAEAAEGGGIRLLDPLLLQHLLALEAPKRPKTGAERAREYRQRHKGVTPTVTKPSDTARDVNVMQQSQNSVIAGEKQRHKASQSNSNNNIEEYRTTTLTPVVVDQNDLLEKAKVLLSAWPPAAAAVDAVAVALSNHSPEFVNSQISYSRQNAKNSPVVFLKSALKNDWASFYATEEIKAAAAAEKHAKAAKEAARQAEEDALLPAVTPEEFFTNINQLEALTSE